MNYVITNEHDGLLLRTFLQQQLLLSHAEITRLKAKENGITVNGNHATVRYILRAGDCVCLDISDTECSDICKTDIPLSVLYEDEHIIAVDKISGMPTHPSHGHYDDTLANALLYYFEKNGQSSVFRAVTRLDKDTSGIVLCAKSAYACSRLSSDMQNGKFKKSYIALVHGDIQAYGMINKNIRRREKSVILRCVCDENEGKTAITEYEKISYKNGISFVSLKAVTGRTHQLRVHCQHVGCAIVGDALYGINDGERLMLHAKSLTFPHPVTQKLITVDSPIPERFKRFI